MSRVIKDSEGEFIQVRTQLHIVLKMVKDSLVCEIIYYAPLV